MKNRKKCKGGFSIVEAIIALSIIVVVSIAAATITLSSISLRYTLTNRSIAINFADNAVECFKAAEDKDSGKALEEFEALVNSATGVSYNTETSTKSGGKGNYTYEHNNFKAKITVDFDSDRPKFEIVVNEIKKDGRPGDEIISLEYVKGAK